MTLSGKTFNVGDTLKGNNKVTLGSLFMTLRLTRYTTLSCTGKGDMIVNTVTASRSVMISHN